MNCPDRATLLALLAEGSDELALHLDECGRCRALAESESALGDALGRLRDPAPPGELLPNVLARVDALAAERVVARRQMSIALGAAAALVALILGAFWRPLVLEGLRSLSSLGTAATALTPLGRTLGPALASLSTVLLAAEVLALVSASLVFHRLLNVARARSS